MVENSTQYRKIEGSNPAIGTRREKNDRWGTEGKLTRMNKAYNYTKAASIKGGKVGALQVKGIFPAITLLQLEILVLKPTRVQPLRTPF